MRKQAVPAVEYISERSLKGTTEFNAEQAAAEGNDWVRTTGAALLVLQFRGLEDTTPGTRDGTLGLEGCNPGEEGNPFPIPTSAYTVRGASDGVVTEAAFNFAFVLPNPGYKVRPTYTGANPGAEAGQLFVSHAFD